MFDSDILETPAWIDAHCHFRQKTNADGSPGLLPVVRETAAYCAYAVAMPNTQPPVITGSDIERYRNEILQETRETPWFDPIMTCNVCDTATEDTIRSAHAAGALAGKVYPRGRTTNAANGLESIKDAEPLFEVMQDLGMRLLIHGESTAPRTIPMDRESRFLPDFVWLVERFPDLRIVLEHVSTAEAVSLVRTMPKNVSATITGHHLVLTLDDVIGDGCHPHNMCMPVAKRYEDRDALVAAAISGNPKFMLGSDTAPHLKEHKECAHGRCGAFTAPLLPSLIIELFEQRNALNKLNGFVSRHAAKFYGVSVLPHVWFERKPWVVPDLVHGVVPFWAGKTMEWQVLAMVRGID